MSLSFQSGQRRQGRGASGHLPIRISFSLICLLILLGLVMAACSDDTPKKTGNGVQTTPTPAPLSLAQLAWCDKPHQVFRDQASPRAQATNGQASTLGPADGKPKTIADWKTMKDNLGFDLYLPKNLPAGTCLLNVSGSLRDPIFGSNFTITYVLPNQDAISFSQAPVRIKNVAFQCTVSQDTNATARKNVTPTATAAKDPVQLCNGIHDKTNIVFSARGTTAYLQQFFQNLQANVDWTPAK
ncbi:hypothetical protein KDA_26940 [Dictyobacter alpinus]|uniref:Uncharacterized protein n=1 Tax=Dictyobacter alpinus TaxID=2014873 RepID=A0A402B7D0_9CHLR|nr:hypothetical protein [Dictyobacter alpinus]GCE27210.1 hypothetical protein KDA_26940 [Dictyobacter alpinus]